LGIAFSKLLAFLGTIQTALLQKQNHRDWGLCGLVGYCLGRGIEKALDDEKMRPSLVFGKPWTELYHLYYTGQDGQRHAGADFYLARIDIWNTTSAPEAVALNCFVKAEFRDADAETEAPLLPRWIYGRWAEYTQPTQSYGRSIDDLRERTILANKRPSIVDFALKYMENVELPLQLMSYAVSSI
jgi:hypothetical protein